LATVAIDTFMTELSSVMRNWLDASVRSTSPVFCFTRASATCGWYPGAGAIGVSVSDPMADPGATDDLYYRSSNEKCMTSRPLKSLLRSPSFR